jgi:hypothetical protein
LIRLSDKGLNIAGRQRVTVDISCLVSLPKYLRKIDIYEEPELGILIYILTSLSGKTFWSNFLRSGGWAGEMIALYIESKTVYLKFGELIFYEVLA